MTGAGYVSELSTDFIDGLTDSGRWRERGITHWHPVLYEDVIFLPNGRLNERPFRNDHVLPLVEAVRPVAVNPREALTWLASEWTSVLADPNRCPHPVAAAQQRGWHDEQAWRFQLQCSWETMAGCSLITSGGGWRSARTGAWTCTATR